MSVYRGRIAPTPTGLLHVGHARTFAQAAERAKRAHGQLLFRIEDLDAHRCRDDFAKQSMQDCRWLGFEWNEGPDIGGPFGPYIQSQRIEYYREIWKQLHATGLIYPCDKSRKDVERALVAPHAEDEQEPIFPLEFRPNKNHGADATEPGNHNWRFRIPLGEEIKFIDQLQGAQSFTAGKDFGDFLIWRKDGFPSYELAVVADDHAMQITEVVRGADLLLSTARQLLIYRALHWTPPEWAHVPLVKDAHGQRLAKRTHGLSIQELRAKGFTADAVLTAPLNALSI
jgi:glutamyl-tRNA synthetase